MGNLAGWSVVVAVAVCAASATGAEARRIVGIGGFVGYSDARDADEGTVHVGGDLSIRPFELLGGRLEVGYREDELEPAGDGFQIAKVESIPILLSAQIFPFGDRLEPLAPFLIGGGGWFVTRTEERFDRGDGAVRFRRTRADQAWHVGGGLDWNLGRHLTLGADVRWMFLDVELRELPDADADGLWVTAAIRFFL